MKLVMNKLLDPELTRDSSKEVKEKQTIEKTEDDTMFSWNGVSLFNTEESALKSQHTCKTTEDKNLANNDNAKLSKVQELQGKSKRQANVKARNDIPQDTTCKQEIEPRIKPAKSLEDDEEGRTSKLKE